VAACFYRQTGLVNCESEVEKMLKKLSPAIFGIALICFFLPWVNVSCQGQKVITLSGIQLVTGTTIEEPKMFSELKGSSHPYLKEPRRSSEEYNKIKGEVLAILTFLAAIVGLSLNFLKGKIGTLGSAIAGGIGTILLLLLSAKLNNDIFQQGRGLLQLDYRIGFYLTLILFILAIGVNVYSIVQVKVVSSISATGKRGYKYCTQCGSKNAADNLFCSECGSKFD